MNTLRTRTLALSLTAVTLFPAAAFAGPDITTPQGYMEYLKSIAAKAHQKSEALCGLLKKDEIARYFGPVSDGSHSGPDRGCTWIADNGSGDLVTLTRKDRSEWDLDQRVGDNKPVAGIGERASYQYSPRVGVQRVQYSGEALNARGVTLVVMYGHGSRDGVLSLLRTAVQR